MFFWTMLLRMPLQPRGNIPPEANITFLEDSLGHNNKTSNISISRFSIYMCVRINQLEKLEAANMDGWWMEFFNLINKQTTTTSKN